MTITVKVPNGLTYTQQHVYRRIAQYPRFTCEDIANAMAGDDPVVRYDIASAVEHLVWHGYCERDDRNGAITIREAWDG